MAALLYLKHVYALSDEDVVERWVENPYWHHFSGERYFRHDLPCDPSSLVRWRKRIGEAGCEWLLAQSIEAARNAGVIKRRSLDTVVLDTTVAPKAIAHPTDSRLLNRAREQLVAAAQHAGVALRQSYARVGKAAEAQAGRYAHAKQYNRMRREIRKLRTWLGRVIRDVLRKGGEIDGALEDKLAVAQRLHAQRRDSKNKLYAVHAPGVECLAKVRREVAHIIVSPAHEVGDETGRSVGRSLPVHALLATAACEATGTTYRASWPRGIPRGSGVTCQHQGGWGTRLSGMVNRSELLKASLCMTSQRC